MKETADTIGMFLELSRILRRKMGSTDADPACLGHIGQYALQQVEDSDTPTLTEFAQRMSISPSTASALVDRLARHGVLRRTRDRTNKRRVVLSLTAEGRAAVRRGNRRKQKLLQEMFACLSAKDQDQLRSILTRVLSSAHTSS